MKTNLTIEQVNIGELRPAEYNPRKWDQNAITQLTESIKSFGLIDPIIVNGAKDRKGIIIGGHFRYHVARSLGYTQVPVVYLDIPDVNREQELNLRLNKNQGAFDLDLLVNMGEDLLLKVGFQSQEMDKMFGLGDEDEDEFDPDEALRGISQPKSKRGDIYALGRHKLMCGDATSPEDVKKLMLDLKAQMVFTDPPYNVDYVGKTKDSLKIENDKMNPEQFKDFIGKAIKNIIDHCDGVFYICMSSKELASSKDVFEQNGGHWQGFIIWVKNTFVLGRNDWQNQYEPILYGWNKGLVNHYFAGFRDEGNVWQNLETLKPTFDGQKTTIKLGDHHLEIFGQVDGRVCKKKDCVDIWHEKKPSKSTEHPTMKPIKLVIKAIKASSKRDDIVLDLFGGSGSTLIAAEQVDRTCHMMELDEKYVDVIISRWEKLTGDTAIKLN